MEIRKNLNFFSNSEKETYDWALKLGQKLIPGTAVGLKGNLGAGKTIIAKGITAGLKCETMVTSPTYTLVNEYQGLCPIYHMDLYRLVSANDWHETGLDSYFTGESICIVEWPEKIPEFPEGLDVIIEIDNGKTGQRDISLQIQAESELLIHLEN